MRTRPVCPVFCFAMLVAACGTSTATTATHSSSSTRDAAAHVVDAHADASDTSDANEASAVPLDAAVAANALPVGQVGHTGRWLTDTTGRVLLLHGVNVVNKNAPFTPAAEGFADDDAAWLADNGFRVVRVGILASGLMPAPGMVDTSYIAEIAATVTNLASHGIYSLLDFHQDGWGPVVGSDGFPAWMTVTGSAMNVPEPFPFYYEENPALQQAFQSFWDDAAGPDGVGLQEDYTAMFSAVAKQLAGEPYVLGYDLLNEPWPGTTWMPCQYDAAGCPALDASELAPVYTKVVTAIRAAGDRHLIFGEPFVLFNFGVSTTSLTVPGADSNAGMAFHVYPALMAQAPDVISNALAWSASNPQGALLNTEWGASTDPTLLTAESQELDAALVPWIFWSFDSELVPSLASPPGGANEVAASVQVLVQPYPLAVAGTPETLTVDATAQTLSFTWSTVPVAGGPFASGTVTTFEAPVTAYPAGYTATATHGTITSSPCAPLLTVVADTGATTVTVDMQPGGNCR